MTYIELIWNIVFILLSPLIFLLRLIISLFCSTKKICIIRASLEKQLGDNYHPLGGYKAGTAQYANVWTRDSFFALMAPIPEKESRLTKFVNRLQLTMNHDNHVAFTFNEVYYLPMILFGKKIKRNNILISYKDEKYHQGVMDANAQYIIMCYQAFLLNGDLLWLESHYDSIIKAIRWYDVHLKDGLIYEKPFGKIPYC